MNIYDYIIIILVVLIFALLAYKIFKNRKKGCSSCKANCTSCKSDCNIYVNK